MDVMNVVRQPAIKIQVVADRPTKNRHELQVVWRAAGDSLFTLHSNWLDGRFSATTVNFQGSIWIQTPRALIDNTFDEQNHRGSWEILIRHWNLCSAWKASLACWKRSLICHIAQLYGRNATITWTRAHGTMSGSPAHQSTSDQVSCKFNASWKRPWCHKALCKTSRCASKEQRWKYADWLSTVWRLSLTGTRLVGITSQEPDVGILIEYAVQHLRNARNKLFK